MASLARIWPRFLAYILILELPFVNSQAQFSPCPANATSCCQCITTPGCFWYYGPMESNTERLPRCRPLALVAERPETYSQHYLTPPGLVNIVDVPQRMNRPINPQRNRLLRPQTARVTIGLGMRQLVPIQVLAQSRRIRLKVTGPNDAPEFTLQRGDSLSCIHRFRVRDRGNSDRAAARTRRPRSEGRTRAAGRGSRRNSRQKQLHVDCYVSAPGDIQSLNLVVDMNRCYAGKKTLRVMIRQRGIKRTKVEVSSACSCPCQGEGGEVVPGQDGLCLDNQREQACVSVDEHGADTSECSGVNNYCQRNEDETMCSGHGICICSVCMCNVLPNEANAMAAAANHSLAIQQRYRGWYCQCDDTSCPWSNGAICGGPTRGICVCGECQCHELYRGADCGGTTAVDGCIDGNGGRMCSDHGMCVDGVCLCQEGYMGPLCEVCSICPTNCNIFRPCVACLLLPSHRGPQANCDEVCASPGTNVTISMTTGEWPHSCQICTFEANDCSHEYAYSSSFDDEGGSHVSLYYRPVTGCASDESEAV